MKKIEIYPRMKRLIASVLIPVSLAGCLTSCRNKEATLNQPSQPSKIISDMVSKVTSKLPLTYMQSIVEVIELKAIAKEYVDIDISILDLAGKPVALIGIEGLKEGTIEDERFYELFGSVLHKCQDDGFISLHLSHYNNQIDFTKPMLCDQDMIDLYLYNSQSVNVSGIEDCIKSIMPINSSINDLEAMEPYFEKNNVSISFDSLLQGDQTMASHIQTFFGDHYVKTGSIFIRSMDSNEATELNQVISKLKCSEITLDYVYGTIHLDPCVQQVKISNADFDLEITAADQAHVMVHNFTNQLFASDLDSPLVRGLSNVDVLDLYYGYGPVYPYDIMRTPDSGVHIRITQDQCAVLSEHTYWDIAAMKDEEGKWQIDLQFDEPTLEKQKTR